MTNPQQPPQEPYPTPTPRINGLSIAGFIVSPVGLVAAFGDGGAGPVLLGLIGFGLSVAGIRVAPRYMSGLGLGAAGLIIAVFALLVGAVNASGGSSSRGSITTPTAPVYVTPTSLAPSYSAPTTQALPAGAYSAGTYVVGSNIQPGTYSTPGVANTGSTLCGWFRLKDTTGDAASILAGGNADGPTTITIKPTDGAVEFQGNCRWTKR